MQNDQQYLPQRGFGQIHDFAALAKAHKVLFRVYTPRSSHQAAVSDDDLFFVAGPSESDPSRPSTSTSASPQAPSYADVLRHLDWITRGNDSSCVSASFSFSWSLWEAYKRYHLGVKRDVHIAVIDAEQVSACTPTEVLSQCPPEQRQKSHWKWYNAVQDSQSVLIYESVRRKAILASVPLRPLLDALPSYFNADLSSMFEGWLGSSQKPSYSTFCREMTSRFLNQNESTRLHAATAGALRSSWGFLQPWFLRGPDDRQSMTQTLSVLACQIAHWPAPVWSVQHPEIERIILETSSLLVNHLLDNRKESEASFSQLEEAVQDLERILEGYREALERRATADDDFDEEPGASSGSESAKSDSLPNTPSTVYEPLPSEGKDRLLELEEGLDLLELGTDEPLAGPATTHLALPSQEESKPSEVVLPSEKELPSVRNPTVLEQASVATLFFFISAFATLFASHSATPLPLMRNIT
ncbi:hypothetical protein DL96DRAFT_1679663 [Flagelloscypha sp. PMI_526]|nr:hypothetical protein DL96DRAFT_1679663 [Flagelloscypha sp. PMI_526]